jgi:3-methylfumaryl-CoA hydratase
LAATLDVSPPDTVPPLCHWTSFLDRSPTATLGPDGHPREGGLIPDPPYPRRMFAGGRMRWNAPLPLDTPIRRTTTVGEVVRKEGGRGPLAFVTVEMTYSVDGQPLAVEEQDLVYLPDAPQSPAPVPNGAKAPRVEEAPGATPDLFASVTFHETTLFRFSALTFNTHRIHYDLPYTRDIEGHPGLVVHGPMLVMRLLDVVRAAHRNDMLPRLPFVAGPGGHRAKPCTVVRRDDVGLITVALAGYFKAVADVTRIVCFCHGHGSPHAPAMRGMRVGSRLISAFTHC